MKKTTINFDKLKQDLSNAKHSVEAKKHKHYSANEHFIRASFEMAVANYINDIDYELDKDAATEELASIIDDLYATEVIK